MVYLQKQSVNDEVHVYIIICVCVHILVVVLMYAIPIIFSLCSQYEPSQSQQQCSYVHHKIDAFGEHRAHVMVTSSTFTAIA